MPLHPEPLIIIGIDPGTCLTGYGIISYTNAKQTALDFGCIRPPAKSSPSEKYLIIFESIEILLDKYKPHALAVETQFVYKNAQSALKLGIAQGVAIIQAKQRGLAIFGYSPREVKCAICGTGRASKWQIQGTVQRELQLKVQPEPEDAADALAIALCHARANRSPLHKKKEL